MRTHSSDREKSRKTSDGASAAEDQAASPVKLGNVLVCIDFSKTSDAALQAAIRMCRHTGAKITVLHIWERGPIAATTEETIRSAEDLYAAEERQTRAFAEELRQLGLDANWLMLDGSPAGVILQHMRIKRPDLVVLGTKGARALGRLMFGSTAEAIFREARCPVMIVGRCCATNRELAPRPIVVATDFQEDAIQSFQLAAAIASSSGAELHCVHVLGSGAAGNNKLSEENHAKDELKRLVEADLPGKVAPVFTTLYGADISHALVEYAKQVDAELIVLSVRRKWRVASHLPPQRVYRIIMSAPCPVLTIAQTDRIKKGSRSRRAVEM